MSVNQSQIATDWAARGFSCGLWTDPPGQCWEDFVHASDELVMVVSGDVEFEIAGVISRPPPGKELFIPAGSLHSVRNIGTTTSRWLYGYNSPRSKA